MSKAMNLSEVVTKMTKELDLVSVVRCRDCKHSSVLLDEYGNECGHACNITHNAAGWLEVEKDHFCGYGERGEADD